MKGTKYLPGATTLTVIEQPADAAASTAANDPLL
jgi:hypothetical protein